MKKFTFTWSRTDSFEHTVEAETEEEARKIWEKEKYDNPKIYCGEDCDEFGLVVEEVAS
tara:strand:- start:426 stop:602 length:177 start_codon:yes stop_codon:yes gene_type:complete